MKLISTSLSKKKVLNQYNFNSIDTNTIYLQQYIDIIGNYGQKWPFIKVYMVENDRLLHLLLNDTTGELYTSRRLNIVNRSQLSIPRNPTFGKKQFFGFKNYSFQWEMLYFILIKITHLQSLKHRLSGMTHIKTEELLKLSL